MLTGFVSAQEFDILKWILSVRSQFIKPMILHSRGGWGGVCDYLFNYSPVFLIVCYYYTERGIKRLFAPGLHGFLE